jgi:hypothetical protein
MKRLFWNMVRAFCLAFFAAFIPLVGPILLTLLIIVNTFWWRPLSRRFVIWRVVFREPVKLFWPWQSVNLGIQVAHGVGQSPTQLVDRSGFCEHCGERSGRGRFCRSCGTRRAA